LLTRQIKRRLSQIERDLSRIADLVDTTIAADEKLRAKADILVSIPGIAKVTACALLTDMPKLGELSGKQAEKLAGLTPISRQSGNGRAKNTSSAGVPASDARSVYQPLSQLPRVNQDENAVLGPSREGVARPEGSQNCVSPFMGGSDGCDRFG
jgi:transposase